MVVKQYQRALRLPEAIDQFAQRAQRSRILQVIAEIEHDANGLAIHLVPEVVQCSCRMIRVGNRPGVLEDAGIDASDRRPDPERVAGSRNGSGEKLQRVTFFARLNRHATVVSSEKLLNALEITIGCGRGHESSITATSSARRGSRHKRSGTDAGATRTPVRGRAST